MCTGRRWRWQRITKGLRSAITGEVTLRGLLIQITHRSLHCTICIVILDGEEISRREAQLNQSADYWPIPALSYSVPQAVRSASGTTHAAALGPPGGGAMSRATGVKARGDNGCGTDQQPEGSARGIFVGATS